MFASASCGCGHKLDPPQRGWPDAEELPLTVVLSLAAFPYQKFGLQHGTVASVSRTVLTLAELAQMTGEAPVKEPLYRVDVTLPAQQVRAFGKTEPLRAGMAVEADLMLERRSLLEWIFEPFVGMERRLGDGP